MMIWRRGVVREIGPGWRGVQELLVEVTEPVEGRTQVRALSYLETTGSGRVGDEVILTAAALSRGLGTGGYAFVTCFPSRLPPDPPPAPGHIVKARYTPSQTMRLGVDEQESPHHLTLREAESLGGMPVVVADLHSALPAIVAGFRHHRPDARVVYVMTDGGALPHAFSRTAAALAEAGWVDGTVTVGQAYGGDWEAVNIYTGLLAAAHVAGADLAVVTQGPGNLGTGTRWGFSGTSAGEVLNAAHLLGGAPVGSLRVSRADTRARHRGVSHHSTTVYAHLTHVPATIVAPAFGGDFGDLLAAQVAPLAQRHAVVWEPTAGLEEALAASPVELSTMGRTKAEDPTPFLAAAAAGAWVARHGPAGD